MARSLSGLPRSMLSKRGSRRPCACRDSPVFTHVDARSTATPMRNGAGPGRLASARLAGRRRGAAAKAAAKASKVASKAAEAKAAADGEEMAAAKAERKAAKAKKHVLCEKPVAINAADAREMIRACRDNGQGQGYGYGHGHGHG